MRASLACHVGAVGAVAAFPGAWPWAAAAIATNHVLLTGAGLWPRSDWLGPNLSRLPPAAVERREVALTFDDGPDPAVTPAVLDLLDAADLRATFFCIAEHARRHPQLCRRIVDRGHSVQNHTDRHSHRFSLLGPAGFAREIGAAQRTLADITGVLPRYFRAPAGLRNPLLGPVLRRLDLELVSWTRRGYDTAERSAPKVLARLARNLRAGDILLLHDGHAARDANGQAVVLSVLPDLLGRLRHHDLKGVTLPHALQAWPAMA